MSQSISVARPPLHFWRVATLVILVVLARFGSLALPADAWIRTGVAGHGESQLTAGAWTSCWVEPHAADLPETPFFSPGLPGLLSSIHHWGISAHPDLFLRWFALLMGCLVPLAAYALVLTSGACPNRAFAAGALIAIDPLLIAASVVPVPAALVGSMVIFSITAAVGAIRSESWIFAALAGLTAGCTSLLEARLMPWAIFLMSWTIFQMRLQPLGWMAMVSGTLMFMIPLAMTTAATAKQLGEPWPVSPSWGTYWARGVDIDSDSDAPAAESPIQRSKRMGHLAYDKFRQFPASWIALRWKNIPSVLLGTDTPTQIPALTGADTHAMSVSTLTGWWLLLLPLLAWIGLITMASRVGDGGLVAWTLLIMPLPWLMGPVTPDLSARIPLEPILVLVVALGVLRHPVDTPAPPPMSGS